MDSMDGFDQTKENIQPLAQGRKTLQFEAALCAQNNPEAHQELCKIAENYERELRTYDGDDPLALWYEYICWVEQSYPKGGKEGNLCSLLEKCLTHFKDNKAYLQDGRLVRLWIKYIEGNYEGKRAELYSRAHCHGVGTQSALFYRFWAYELERSGDHKNADKIYRMGLDHNAQPKEELANAHNNFMASMASLFLNGTMPSPQRPDASDRRVLAALQANRKNQVPNVRVGAAINTRLDRRPMSLGGNQVQQAAIKIFRDEQENSDLNFPQETMRSLPKNSVVNKENSLSAGPWTGPPRRKTQPAPSTLVTATRPSFQVHTDDEASAPREPPRGSVMNALQPIKDPLFEIVPMTIFEEPNPNRRCMYPKNEVYAGGMEFSLEELRAARYLKKGTHLKYLRGSNNENIPFRSDSELACLEAQQFSESNENAYLHQSSTATKLSFNNPTNESNTSSLPRNSRRKTMFFANGLSQSSEIQPRQEHMQDQAIPGGQLRTIDRSQSRDLSRRFTNDRQQELNVLPNESCSSTEPSMLHSQSITVNTKEAMSVMNELWGSTCDRVQQSHARNNACNERTYVVSALPLECEAKNAHVDIPPKSSTRVAGLRIFADCEGQSNSLRLTQSEFSSNVPEDANQVKENIAYSRKTFSAFSDEEVDYEVPKPANSIKNDFVIYQEDAHQNQLNKSTKSTVIKEREFVIYQEGDDAQQTDENVSTHKLTVSKKTEFVIFQEEEDVVSSQKPADVWKNDFVICQDEDEDRLDMLSPWPEVPQPGGIPVVPSPGMTSAQVQALLGTEHKENVSIEPPPKDDRLMAGILQPSIGIPFQPDDNSDSEEAGANIVEPTECFTQAFTQAFNFPLTSSTPFYGNMKKLSPVVETAELPTANKASDDQEIDASQSPTEFQAASLPTRTPTAPGPINLSVIMENSKENYRSGSSSGSSCGGTTTRRTFSASTWSTQESLQRTGRDKSLAAIKELHKESLCEQEDDCHSGFTRASAETDAAFSLNAYKTETDYTNGACREDLFTIGVFNLTSKIEMRSDGDNDLKCEESSVRKYQASMVNESFNYVEKNFHKLELSQDPVVAEGAKHLIKDSLTNGSDKQMKIFVDSFSNDDSKVCRSYADKEDIDPFDEALIGDLLNDLNFPGTERKYKRLDRAMPNHWKPGSSVQMGSKNFEIAGMLGKGSYAKVVKGLLKRENRCSKPEVNALKIQKPSWVWELYISCQLHKRLNDLSMAKAFMEVNEFYEFNNGSVLISEYIEYGTLLSVANKLHSPANIIKTMTEPIAIHFTIELLQILDALHKCKIIHADIKPDNFLLRSLLSKEHCFPTLQLIDYGRAIDMTLFPEGTSFTRVVTTKGFKCVEMQSGRPWTYQTDLFGMASTVHCVLLGDYMNTVCQDGVWKITKKISRGSKSAKLWSRFFHEMLNIESCESMPDLTDLKANFEKELDKKKLISSIGTFNNLVLDN